MASFNYTYHAPAVKASLITNTATGQGSDTLAGIENLTGTSSTDEL